LLKLNHKKMEVWKECISLIKQIYKLTAGLPKEERYGLVSQLNRASVSILSNLSEGSSRKSVLERKRFYEISRSSLVELDSQLEILSELELITEDDLVEFDEPVNKIFAMLSNLIKSTK